MFILGRVGPGDAGWVHDILFVDDGCIAYHSAVHDAFGYLITSHQTGPGYDYLGNAWYFSTENPLAGQFAGIQFWKHRLEEIKTKKNCLSNWRC